MRAAEACSFLHSAHLDSGVILCRERVQDQVAVLVDTHQITRFQRISVHQPHHLPGDSTGHILDKHVDSKLTLFLSTVSVVKRSLLARKWSAVWTF